MTIHILRPGIDAVPPIESIPACEKSKERFRQLLLQLMNSDETFTGEDILRMYEEI